MSVAERGLSPWLALVRMGATPRGLLASGPGCGLSCPGLHRKNTVFKSRYLKTVSSMTGNLNLVKKVLYGYTFLRHIIRFIIRCRSDHQPHLRWGRGLSVFRWFIRPQFSSPSCLQRP